jgi:hypothetical protein
MPSVSLSFGVSKEGLKKWVDSVFEEFKNGKTIKNEEDAKAYLVLRVLHLVKRYDLGKLLAPYFGAEHIVGKFTNTVVAGVDVTTEYLNITAMAIQAISFVLRGDIDVKQQNGLPPYGSLDVPDLFDDG